MFAALEARRRLGPAKTEGAAEEAGDDVGR